ncbi:MAG: hypothetical protein WCJ19_01160 [bacterium]
MSNSASSSYAIAISQNFEEIILSEMLPHQKVRSIQKKFIENLERIGNGQIDLINNMRLSSMQLSQSLNKPSLNSGIRKIAEDHWTLYASILSRIGVETIPVQDNYHGLNHRLNEIIFPQSLAEEDCKWTFNFFFENIANALEHGSVAGANALLNKIENHYMAVFLSEIYALSQKSNEDERKTVGDIIRIIAEVKDSHLLIGLTALKAYSETLVDREEPKFVELINVTIKAIKDVIDKANGN